MKELLQASRDLEMMHCNNVTTFMLRNVTPFYTTFALPCSASRYSTCVIILNDAIIDTYNANILAISLPT